MFSSHFPTKPQFPELVFTLNLWGYQNSSHAPRFSSFLIIIKETSYSLGKRISIRAKRSTPLIFGREVKELLHGQWVVFGRILSRPSPETGCPSVPWLWISNSLQRCICLRLLQEVTDSSVRDDKIQFAQVEIHILEEKKKNEAFSIFAFGGRQFYKWFLIRLC